MKRFGPISLLLFLLALFPAAAEAQTPPWSGVLSPTRGAAWASAGVPGGIPSASWTQCGSTIAAYGSAVSPASPATIQTAITNCTANHYVQLGAGTFYLSGSFYVKGQSNVVIRGMGANVLAGGTAIYFHGDTGVGGDNCNGIYATICFESADNNYSGSVSNSTTWTAGYSQGTTVITLASVPNLRIGNPVILDQLDFTSDTGAILITGAQGHTNPFTAPGNPGPYSTQGAGPVRPGRSLAHVYTVTGCNGSTTIGTLCSGANVNVTIDPPLEEGYWNSSLSPGAWWATSPDRMDGVENLYIDGTNNGCTAGNAAGIGFVNTVDTWVSGVEDFNECRDHTLVEYSARVTVRNQYMFLARFSTSTSYGLETFTTSDSLFENNICQAIVSCVILGSASDGNVVGYNFSINAYYASIGFSASTFELHNADNDYNLWEGNIGSGIAGDIIHGSKNLDTLFRNRLAGMNTVCWQGSSGTLGTYAYYLATTWGACTSNIEAIQDQADNRFFSIIGNVLGTAGVMTGYVNSGNFGLPNYAMNIGTGDTTTCAAGPGCNVNTIVPPDPTVPQTAMIWGNCDPTNGGVGGAAFTACAFNSANVPVTANLSASQQPYANFIPSSTTLPASFYYSSTPSWWPSGKPWPIIGPDVTGGNVPGVNGLAYTNPAQDCYNSLTGSTSNGTGGPFPFDATTCYGSESLGSGPPPAAPTNLSAVVN